jgi:TRAP-type C4-dicarboxylate transport system permease small subunit
VSNESDGEKGGAAKGGAIENTPLQDAVPPTRPSAAVIDGEPPVRPSAAMLPPGPLNYPDDGPIAGGLRKVDHLAGLVEQILLFSMLGIIVLVGTFQALATKLFGTSFVWSFDVVRGCTFAIAMIGAAFASHHASHLSMDIVSRWMSPRSRLAAQVVLGLFAIFAAFLLLQSGLHLRTQVASEGGSHTIPPHLIAAMIPVGAGMMIFHTLLRVLIDADYLRRGKLPPPKAMSAH